MGDTITLNLKRPSFKTLTTLRRRLTLRLAVLPPRRFHQRHRSRAHQPRRAGGIYAQLDDVQVQAEKIRARVVFNRVPARW